IVGSVGTVFKTTDFGISYSYIDSGTSNSLNDIYVNESGNGFLVGNEYAGKIRDEEIDPLVDTVLLLGVEYKRLVLALTGGSLFFAGTGGALYETPDFGENFIRIPVIVGSTSSSGDFGDDFGDSESSDAGSTGTISGDSGSQNNDFNDDFGDSGSGTSDVGAGTGGKIAEFSLSNADFSFSHNVGQTSCPQKVGEFVITNSGTDSLAMSIAVLNNAPLAADPSGGFELKSGESRTISLFFTCAQASSFAGTLDISGITTDGVLVSKTVQVSGNVN
ncbi:MAG: hypothetical protein KDD70_17430, partial [Bdellovibrionales bacterium]|nr:hypothetical protein [Bdellovibrionales bacterium]